MHLKCRFCLYPHSRLLAYYEVASGHARALLASRRVVKIMIEPKQIRRTLAALLLYCSWAIAAYGRPAYSLRSLTGQTETMSFLAWIGLGLVAGFIGSKIVNRRGEGIVLDILLGIVGAFAGGWLFHLFGARGVSGLNLYSLVVAVVGSVVFLVLYHALFRRRRAW